MEDFEDFGVWRDLYLPSNNISKYKVNYFCRYGCDWGSCPGHTAFFIRNQTHDSYHIKLRNHFLSIDPVELDIILDFIVRLKDKEDLIKYINNKNV